MLAGGADATIPLITPRLSITVYPQNLARNMAAHGTLPLAELIFAVTASPSLNHAHTGECGDLVLAKNYRHIKAIFSRK